MISSQSLSPQPPGSSMMRQLRSRSASGRPVAARACVIPAHGVAGRNITTLEGLGSRAEWHPVQAAFEQAQAAQCGYCLNGMLMMTVALLARTPQPTEQQVRQALSANLCRCGTHVEIIAAALRAAELTARAAKGSA